jgi:hypothetical protein
MVDMLKSNQIQMKMRINEVPEVDVESEMSQGSEASLLSSESE